MHQPDALKRNAPLTWSPGNSAEVWQLFVACIGGDLATVKPLVAAKPNLADDPPWAGPLAWAERPGDPAIAELLRRHGAGATGRTKTG